MKKAEHWKIDGFELRCRRRLLRVPWTARRSKQSILRKSTLTIRWKHWCWRWSANTLATWCEEPTHWKEPDAGRDWGQEEKGTTEDEMIGRHHWLNGQDFVQTLGEWRVGKPGMLQSMESQRVGYNWTTEQQQQQLSESFQELLQTMQTILEMTLLLQ